MDKYGIYMQHLENMAEDESFPATERAKFKGWHKKWTMGRIPILACVAIEVLAPAKILSKTFQSADVDLVSASSLNNQAKKGLKRIKKKDFEQLPTVKRFLERVKEDNGQYSFQDVKLKDFIRAKEAAKKVKDEWVQLVSDSFDIRLDLDQDDSTIKFATVILNTEVWQSSVINEEAEEPEQAFGIEAMTKLYDLYRIPLERAGFSGSLSDLLEQWESLCEYTVKYLNPQSTDYRVTWRKIFQSSRRNMWSLVLLLVELLFSLPVSNAKVERLFSLMNRIKTDSRSCLSQKTLKNLILICMEGPDSDNFNAVPAMKLWSDTVKARRPNQKAKRKYKERAKKTKPYTLMEIDTTESDCDISDDSAQ